MPPSSFTFKQSVLVGVFLVSTTVGANAMTVTRCNLLTEGVYVPTLVVRADGEMYTHAIGVDGLTRNMLYDPDAALAWAMSVYGGEPGSFSWSECYRAVSNDDDSDDVGGGYLEE